MPFFFFFSFFLLPVVFCCFGFNQKSVRVLCVDTDDGKRTEHWISEERRRTTYSRHVKDYGITIENNT